MQSKEQILRNTLESLPLPSLPHLLIKLIAACDDEDAPISAIAPLVAMDASLASRVLRLVNSAYFGLNRTFSSIEQAVIYLGASTVKSLAITASIQQVFKGLEGDSGSFQIGQFWYHSLLCATLGKRIAKAVNYTNIEEAYLSCLLHNIGQLVLFASFPEEYTLIQAAKASGGDECSEEEQQIGITHCEAGFTLLKNWNIGALFADAALYHHTSVEQIQEGFPLVKITFLANRISGLEGTEAVNGHFQGGDLFDLDRVQVDQIVVDAREEVIAIAQELEVKIKIPSTSSLPDPINGERHHLSGEEEGRTGGDEVFIAEIRQLGRQVKNDSLINVFIKNLLRTEGREPILAATEEIIRILFGCETIFFLLYDSETGTLTGNSSSENRLRGLVQDLVLPAENKTSFVFRSLTENRVLTFFQDGRKSPNLADVQLFNIVNSKGMMYLPMLARQEQIGVIVLGLGDKKTGIASHSHNQYRLIANQAAISLHLEDIQKKEVQKLHAERMATATLAAKKIVHEVNNPLGIISNYLKLLEMKIPDDTDIRQDLQILDEEISRISALIGQLSNFATTPTSQKELINVNDLISNMLRILTPSLFTPSDIKVHFISDPDLAEIVTDKDKLKQIIINILKNSTEAMGNGGSVSIATMSKVEKDIGRGVVITLSDDGPGIPSEIQQKLFSPFMTTKKDGHSGLGLSIVNRAVHELGGTIECRSGGEKGTQFTIFLPLDLSNFDNDTRG